jgi:hypothetical protein
MLSRVASGRRFLPTIQAALHEKLKLLKQKLPTCGSKLPTDCKKHAQRKCGNANLKFLKEARAGIHL